MLNQEYDGEDHFVVAKNKGSAKHLVVDYYAQMNDGNAGVVTMNDLDVNGPVDPNDYPEETVII